jgi:hypothetical protein
MNRQPPIRRIGPSDRATFLDRVIGVLTLDTRAYEAIKRDPGAMGQSAAVVIVSALATNTWVALFAPRGATRAIGGVVLAIVAWVLFAGLVWWVGRRWFAPNWAPPDFRTLLRLTGFATAPGLLNILGFVPVIGWLVLMVASIWSLITAYTAVRVGLATNERYALAATFIAYVANALLFALAARLLGIGQGVGLLG